MAAIPLPEIADLRNRVIYDPFAGTLTWTARPVEDFTAVGLEPAELRARQWNTRCALKPAFASPNKLGYLVGHFRSKLLAAHRVAFAIQTGRWPTTVDHINGMRMDNRWSNLREVTARQNLMNNATRSDSATGRTGVRINRRKTGKPFFCSIKVNGRSCYLGSFDTFEEAVARRIEAERLHGYSERHGIPLPH